MSGFNSSQTGDFDRYFMTTTELIDKYSQGGLWVWGSNSSGQLGANHVLNKNSPVQTVAGGANWKSVSCGLSHTAAIKTDGTLWTWGYNNMGQLGTNNTTHISSPVQTVAGGTNWKYVSSGSYHTTTIKTDGTLWGCGYNDKGQLGTNDITNRSSPIQTVAGGTNWNSVSAGNNYTAAIKTDGTLWSWGTNFNGTLGTNDTTNRSSPVQTATGGTNWKSVACGGYHTAAIKTDGTLWIWGNNSYGQLGTNNTTSRSSPVQTATGGTNWKSVSCGSSHTVAIKTDGTLWACGYNDRGQLGTNDRINRSSPVQTVTGGTNWKFVAGGGYNTAAIKTDGTLWLCGYNIFGQLGTDNTTSRSSPIQTIAGGTNWKSVSCSNHTSALQYSDIGQVL